MAPSRNSCTARLRAALAISPWMAVTWVTGAYVVQSQSKQAMKHPRRRRQGQPEHSCWRAETQDFVVLVGHSQRTLLAGIKSVLTALQPRYKKDRKNITVMDQSMHVNTIPSRSSHRVADALQMAGECSGPCETVLIQRHLLGMPAAWMLACRSCCPE